MRPDKNCPRCKRDYVTVLKQDGDTGSPKSNMCRTCQDKINAWQAGNRKGGKYVRKDND